MTCYTTILSQFENRSSWKDYTYVFAIISINPGVFVRVKISEWTKCYDET